MKYNISANVINILTIKTIRLLNFRNMFNVLNDHILDQDPLNNHVVQLVYVILRIFLLLD